ncbi:aldo/keto reductase [Agromyces atrinae]|uniref:Aldo/keto reductase n=1 Tax=Agromyces atrinae TaxID=592376 RepID=A0A4Q2M5T1_9MICO|nr:aldo/keto reductase [Agromyces atrinae]NYD68382.1 aryl-alcohol dehydrogenase-like predicted oxidoreductase [Agromyces atrinae]RXZ85132.1 aldo/keto reductase [Agromyces atrinae]
MTNETPHPTNPLGTTGMDITRVGFGAWAIGGSDWAFGWGAQDDADSVAAIRHAVEAGVNWIDTAAVYGLGHSEEVVARALADLPEADRPYVFTKGGMVWDLENRRERAKRVGDPASIRREAEASLRRLGVERIDLYQMHWPAEDGTPLEEYWQTFVDLRDEGKVRAIGLSNHSVEQLEAAEAIGHVDTLQPPFSAIRRGVADEILPWCAANDTGVIVYSPMGSGLLTGAFSAERVANLPDDDWRRNSADFTTNLDANLRIGDALARVAARHRVSQAAAAAAWTLGFDGVTAAIVGARSPEQIDGWIAAADLELTPEDYAEVAAAF